MRISSEGDNECKDSIACLEKDKKFGVKNLGELKEVEGSEAGDKTSAGESSSKPW